MSKEYVEVITRYADKVEYSVDGGKTWLTRDDFLKGSGPKVPDHTKGEPIARNLYRSRNKVRAEQRRNLRK